MKNHISLFAFVFSIIGCVNNPPPKNAVEQVQIALAPSLPKDSTSFSQDKSTSVAQNAAFQTSKITRMKKHPLSKKTYLPPIITLEPNFVVPPQTVAQSDSFVKNTNNFSKKSQFFTVKSNIETVLKGEEGTTLTIPSDCFETKTSMSLRDTKQLSGVIQIEIKEFFKTSDMILSNLTTQSDGKLLETGGMIFLDAKDENGQSLKI